MGSTSGAAERAKPVTGNARPARRRLSVDRRREELMAAALELFSRRDAEYVSIDDVASAAGASRALVYHYFGGKQELYVAALKSAAAQLEARLRPQGDGRPLAELADGLSRYFDFVEEHAAGFAALLKGGPANSSGEIGEVVDAVRHRLLKLIMKQMRVEEPGPVLRVTLRSWIASVETAGLDWLERRDIERPALERMLVGQMVALLGAAAEHDPQVAELLDDLVRDRASRPDRHGPEADGQEGP
ncbi:TetR/AcrR family transcriptional regulator [Streptosporangium sp. NPDC002721]|uniref:TetR/AcrR family transcriptional regulator n=1 Tax=Streptosporangium sp. NPDC002721 TaxID=3366188 RepID=UPI0036C2FDC1